MGDSDNVIHDASKHRFAKSINIDGDVSTAFVEYREVNHEVLDFYHTYVPPALRGRGIAEKVMNGAMDTIIKKNQKAYLSCSYLVQHWLPRNPQYSKYIVKILGAL
eukprot:TRINITY_DN2573_c0_g1_i4.p1 TRINITY_DN2573_c0_g1~~TRINITY_DN2573_c0_g1_i4.p1  ORF type:complete len:106 (+),score=17.93 TRINITY_DN2573_c0_g1_i4:310-627(+)